LAVSSWSFLIESSVEALVSLLSALTWCIVSITS
jgi:hypothetical protein